MINRILFFILTRIFKVNPKMCSLDNWRAAHPYEGISLELGFCPLVFKETYQNIHYPENKFKIETLGISNFIFLGLGKVFLVPQLDSDYFKEEKDTVEFKELSDYEKKRIMNRGNVAYTLFKHYIENNPHILVKKFPTKLLIKLLKRQLENQRKNLKNNKDENENVFTDRNLSNAIRSDLSQPSVVSTEEIFTIHQRSFGKE